MAPSMVAITISERHMPWFRNGDEISIFKIVCAFVQIKLVARLSIFYLQVIFVLTYLVKAIYNAHQLKLHWSYYMLERFHNAGYNFRVILEALLGKCLLPPTKDAFTTNGYWTIHFEVQTTQSHPTVLWLVEQIIKYIMHNLYIINT